MSGDHATLSPSGRHRWAACPGSVREEARYPESSGPAAIDGTHTHALLAHCVKGQIWNAMLLVGAKLTSEDGEFTVDMERARRVNVALDYIKERGFQGILAEEKVDPALLLGRSDMSGTVDVQGFKGDTFHVIDYKDGMGYVEVENNPQLELYALGVIAKPEFENYFKTIRMTIIQPKSSLKGESSIRWVDVSVADLKAKIPQIITEAAATDNPDAPLIPGETQCKWCAHKGACSALAAIVSKEIGLMFEPVNGIAVIPGMDIQAANKNPTEMDTDQLRQVLEAAPLVRGFIEGVEAEALRRLEAGQSVPGFKLVRGRGSRKWSFSDDDMAEKLKGMGIPKGALFTTSLVSVAQAEKLSWEKRDGTKVQLTERQLKTIETEYVTKSSGKLTIAPESDSRESVVVNVAPMFSPVEAPPLALPAFLTVPSWLQPHV